jgi:hypothetical protein
VSINRYFGWLVEFLLRYVYGNGNYGVILVCFGIRYGDTGRTEVIQLQMPTEVHSWYRKYGKPVLITEYGAGTVAGMHMVNQYFTFTFLGLVVSVNPGFSFFNPIIEILVLVQISVHLGTSVKIFEKLLLFYILLRLRIKHRDLIDVL